MSRPVDAKYTESHEWIRKDKDTWLVGITDHAVEELADLVALELPKAGARYTKGQSFGEVESVKAVSELFAPVDLEVVDANAGLAEDLDSLSHDAFGKGWLLRVKVTNPSQLSALMDKSAYDEHVAE